MTGTALARDGWDWLRVPEVVRWTNSNPVAANSGAVRPTNGQNRGASLARDPANHVLQNQSNMSRSSSHSNSSHSSSVSPHKHGVGDMVEAIGKRSRNCDAPKDDARTSLKSAFRQHVTDPAKIVAKKVGASTDSVESYRSGNIPQSWAQMIAFCRAYPAFGLEALELMGIDIDRDRDAYAIFLTLQKRVRGE